MKDHPSVSFAIDNAIPPWISCKARHSFGRKDLSNLCQGK
jgi:hypothetical protein